LANRIRIKVGTVSVEAELNDNPTAKKVLAALPIEGRANIWGDEIYFRIPVSAQEEPDSRAEVEVGELGYWPPGSAFCLFYGRTPASGDDDLPCAASPVNILGKVIGDAKALQPTRDGTKVTIEKV